MNESLKFSASTSSGYESCYLDPRMLNYARPDENSNHSRAKKCLPQKKVSNDINYCVREDLSMQNGNGYHIVPVKIERRGSGEWSYCRGLTPSRCVCCRWRLWKSLVMIVLLLMASQLFVSIVFTRNNDSLFYINLPSMQDFSRESKTTWMLSKFPLWFQNGTNLSDSALENYTSGLFPFEPNGLQKASNLTITDSVIVGSLASASVSSNMTHHNNTVNESLQMCPPIPSRLVGSLAIRLDVPALSEQESSHPELESGGHFRPEECLARHRVAIIIPYRDRLQHLQKLLFHLHPILQRQQLDYAIFVIEQAAPPKFNRAMLLNVGSLEALKHYNYGCFVFHDVDLLPEDDRNLYTCPEQPRHMSIAINTMKYILPYNDIFGGVSAMTVEQFRVVNGFSNKFWGWGGEDDDMSNRIKFHNYFISRYPANIGRYTMVSHQKDKPSPARYQTLYDGKKRFSFDGLNSARYEVLETKLLPLYTLVRVNLLPS